jgi:hypothetical protein
MMNKKTVVIAVVAGVATVAITAALSGSKSSSLPLPLTVTSQQAVASRHGSGHSGGGSSTTTTTPSGQGVTTTTLPTLVSCSIALSNPNPTKGLTDEIATVTVVPAAAGAVVRVTGKYPHQPSSHSGQTAANGQVSVNFPIGHVPVGTAVSYTATATLKGKPVTCAGVSTSPVT